MFVTFEGGEGSGKTTAIRTVEHLLKGQGLTVYRFAEPGSTPIGHKLREILLYRPTAAHDQVTARAELLLFCASRAQFTEMVLRPLMTFEGLGTIILCDRYADSTLAYQLYARGLPWHDVHSAVNISRNGIHPDLTLFFDIASTAALGRLEESRRNRLDAEDVTFHERVYAGYQTLMAEDRAQRWRRVDAAQPPEQVAAQAAHIILTAYQETVSR